MKELDKSAFNLSLPVIALRVPTKSVGQIKAELSSIARRATFIIDSDVLKLPKMRNVVNDEQNKDLKMVLLKPEITSTSLDEASDKLRAMVNENGWEVTSHSVTVGYEHWSADEILKAVLPDANEAPTSYEQIGHIAHMNLRDQYLPYKNLIGQVILDKSPVISMVVNKLDTIDNTYRNFKMEVIAGKADFVAQVRENECVFRFDYSKVYWNSRLHSEHERLIKMFKPASSICDVMAGVGPFAVPAGKRGCLVWANDLNPASYSAMEDNIRLNKVQGRVRAFNMDGRDFIRRAFADYYEATKNGPIAIPAAAKSSAPKNKPAAQPDITINSRTFDHVVMNLPAIAIEFLDAFRGLFRSITGKSEAEADDKSLVLPMIHAHCFTKSDEPEKDILQRACRAMGYDEAQYKDLDASIFYVRKVAPNKDMYCLSLRLPKSVAYAEVSEISSDVGSKRKQGEDEQSSEETKDPKTMRSE
ncbi:tRNA(m(1)G37)methyltransferase [Dipsacomyces acuminosporus]|nr:tRNA(m(1)G37)methyltransferase [Dipsacomyces acuminosporus]